jgi:hypothetical protein
VPNRDYIIVLEHPQENSPWYWPDIHSSLERARDDARWLSEARPGYRVVIRGRPVGEYEALEVWLDGQPIGEEKENGKGT